jgi:nucleoside triphosphate diphosphatase
MANSNRQRAPAATGEIEKLIEVMAALRTPVTGCPWDLEQTFSTIAPYTIEEAYEVADAIERGDMGELKEELGDLLLQVVYHARMGEEAEAFDFADVVEAITRKMIRRHPHVFGDEAAPSAGVAKGSWEQIKATERKAKAVSAAIDDTVPAQRLLDDVPVGLPALTRAVKLQDKAATVGFDWPSLDPVFTKLKEELAELEAVVAEQQQPKIAEEFGDVLFVIANVARHLRIDPEAALRRANAKFMRRFRHIEDRLAEIGKTPNQSNLAEMDKLWDDAKSRERPET